MKNKIIHIFKGVSMAYQHDSLTKIARKKKVDVTQLGNGEHVLFLNNRLNKLKLYSGGGVVSYYRAPDGGLINLRMIEQIPSCFSATTGMDWEKAERIALDKLLAAGPLRKMEGEPVNP